MLNKLLITTAVSALMISGAFAQSPSQMPPPAANKPQSPSQMPPPAANKPMAQPAAGSAKFITQQSADQWVFSKFKGTDVLGPDNAHIGDVSDLLFDKSGKVEGIIVGVGGLLGIGEKNVAIDLSAFQVVPADTGSSSTTSTMRGSTDPTNVKLKVSWTKDQLNNAPDFKYFKPASTTSSSNAPAPRTPPANAPANPPAQQR